MNGREHPLDVQSDQEGSLRPLTENDLLMVLGWRNSSRVREAMYTDAIISEAEHRVWFERIQTTKQTLCYIFEYHQEPVGIVNFTQFDERRERCSWGFYLGSDDLPRGVGTWMGQSALQLAFDKLGIHKLCGECFAFNKASISYHRRLGFQEEGRLRRHIWKNGRYEDIISFAKFHDE